MRTVNVAELIENSKFGRFHISVMLWGAFIIIFDGFDLVVYGTIVSSLIDEWGITPVQAGALSSYTLFGLMIGALILGPMADKYGRKNIIILSVGLFSLFTVFCALSNSPVSFGIFRFVAGIGMGGVMTNAGALVTDYAPKKIRSTIVTIMYSGYSVGGVLSVVCGMYLIPDFGWRSVLFVGALPLLSLPFMYFFMPDSPSFYLLKNKQNQLKKILQRISPEYTPRKGDHLEIAVPKKHEIPIVNLFKGGRALSTVMFWVVFFMSLLMWYGLNTWLPNLMANAGFPSNSGLMFLLILNFGSICGAITGGWLADRWTPKRVLQLLFAMAAVSFLAFTLKPDSLFIINMLFILAGFATGGGQILSITFISQYYPTVMRSSGIGWGLGIGRIGAILAPTLGGILLSMNYPLEINFLFLAVPAILATLAVSLIKYKKQMTQIETNTHNGQSNLINHAEPEINN